MSRATACLLIVLLVCGGCAHTTTREYAEAEAMAMRGESLYRAGAQLLREGDLTRAEQYLSSALRAGYDADAVIKALMTACIRAGRLRSALSYAEPHVADHPEQLALRLLVASLHLGLENFAHGERELSFVLRVAEANPEAHYLMALLLLKQGGAPAAVHGHFRRYLELAPRGAHADEAHSALQSELSPTRPNKRPRS